MKFYSIFIIAPEERLSDLKLGRFEHPKVMEINVLGQSQFTYDMAKMMRSHLVITTLGWDEDPKCTKAVEIARLMKFPVILESQFQAYAQENYD